MKLIQQIVFFTAFVLAVLSADAQVLSKQLNISTDYDCNGKRVFSFSAVLAKNSNYSIKLFYGDGNFKNVNFVKQNYIADSSSNTYSTYGTYNIKCLIYDSLGQAIDSIMKVTKYSPCVTLSGYLYLDANKNCLLDGNEFNRYRFGFVYFYDTANSIINAAQADTFGFYSIQIPPNTNYKAKFDQLIMGVCNTNGYQSLTVGPGNTSIDIGFTDSVVLYSAKLNIYTNSDTLRKTCIQDSFIASCSIFKSPGLISVKFDFGDGTIINKLTPFSGYDVAYAKHDYAASGKYALNITIKDTAGNLLKLLTDTIEVIDCILLSGNFFLDQNNNCSKQINEQNIQYRNMIVMDTSNKFSKNFYSDFNGDFSFKFPKNSTAKFIELNNEKIGCTNSNTFLVNVGSTNQIVNMPFKDELKILWKNIMLGDSASIGCSSDSFVLKLYLYNSNLSTVNVLIKWGDGQTTSFTSIGQTIFNTQKHKYASNGIYPLAVYLKNANNSIVDSIKSIIEIVECGIIEGLLFLDSNKNCTLQTSEDKIAYHQLKLKDSNGNIIRYVFTNSSGNYSIRVDKSESHLIEVGQRLMCNGNSSSVTIAPWSSNTVITKNLPINPDSLDYALVTLRSGNTYPNGFLNISFAYTSLFNTPNSKYKITMPAKVTFDSTFFSTNYTKVGNIITYYSTLSKSLGNIIRFKIDTTIKLGDTLCFKVELLKVGNEVDLSNNTTNICMPAFTSFDPNDKTVSSASMISNGNFTNKSDVLNYTIRFQNTGTAPAQNIFVTDQLDAKLDPSTLKILSSSHTMQVSMSDDLCLRFDFKNINLIDSFSNEPLSHGYINYSIQPKASLKIDDVIDNTALIFFDYNEPVVTNTTKAKYVIKKFGIAINNNSLSENLLIYPNPSSNFVIIQSKDESLIQSIEIIDLKGNSLIKDNCIASKTELNLEHLYKGIYLIKVVNEREQSTFKLIKE